LLSRTVDLHVAWIPDLPTEEDMTHQPIRLLAVLPLLAIATAGCVINLDADQVVVRDEKQFKVGAGAELTLDTFDGSIQVTSWDRPEVMVTIEKRGPDHETASGLQVKSSQDGSRVRIEAPQPLVARRVIGIGNSGPSVSFIVQVPRELKLNARTRDGSISVANVNGTIELRSGDGSIKGEAISGDLNARTDDGSMRIVDVNGRVAVHSGDGSIHLEGKVNDLNAQTGDGSIEIEADDGSGMKSDWEVTTGDGSITLRLPRDFSADIDAESRDGRVESGFAGIEPDKRDDDRGTMRGRIGNGGRTVRLRTGDGSIRVLNR